MKLHLLILQFVLTLLLVFVLPIYSYADNKAEVTIKRYKFVPQEITVDVGTTIRWTNKERRQYHSVWFEKSGEPEPDYFFPDEFYERKFDKKGTFPYRCGPHPEMTGVVHVK